MRRRRVTTPTNGSSSCDHDTTGSSTTPRTSCLLLPKSSNDLPEQSIIPNDNNNNQQQQQHHRDTATATGTDTLGDTVVDAINNHHTGIRNRPNATTSITTSTVPNTITNETNTTTGTIMSSSSTPPILSSSSLSSPLSVTIISQNNLPSYSSERFYLLSELEVHAASTVFLSSSTSSLLLNDDHSTQATEEESFNNMTLNNDNTSDDIDDDLHVDPTMHGEDQNQDSNPTTGDNNDNDKMSTTIPHPESNDIPSTVPILTVPSFLILYILWKPNMTTDPQLLIQDTILPAITQIQQQYDVDIVQSSTLIQNYSNFKSYYHPTIMNNSHSFTAGVSSLDSTTTDTTVQQQPSSSRSSASIYIVVDRIIPKKINASTTTTTAVTNEHLDTKQPLPDEDEPDDDDDDDDDEQYRLVESVGRAVASHTLLRDWIDGITIGISDHVRAAPGLELCTDAITKIGNIDRRRYKFHPHHLHPHYNNSSALQASPLSSSSNGNNNNNNIELEAKKSLLSILAMSKGDLLGLQDIANTDAADFVQQSTVTAEWYGQGDIYMFASRAHFVWKQRYNVLIDSESAMDGIHGTIPTSDPFFRKRKLPRRISQPNRREGIMLSSNTTRSTIHSTNQQYRNNYQMTLQQERELLDDIYDLLGYIWVITFILYHFVKFDVTILTSTYDNIMALIQFIIRVWIDLIRSARGW